ncbi:MAG: ABC transporter permease [Anaerolineae bacterium]|nr:ABC transporter permease [Anaerolineae bacterium]
MILFVLIGLSFILTAGSLFFIKSNTVLDKFLSSTQFRQFIYLRDLVREMVSRDMKLRYKRSFLGVAWSLINPLVQLLVLQLIFGIVLNLGIPNYSVFLFTGLLVWTWFQSGLFSAAGVIVDNPDLIKRPNFPIAILPIVTVTTHLIHFLLALPILFIFLIFSGVQLTTVILILPLIILLQFLLTLSLSYFVAAAHVNFRDTQYLLGIILLLGFYLSPIFYSTTVIPEAYHWLYYLNPMVSLIEAYRTILMDGQLPNFLPPIILLVISLVVLILGHTIFTRVSYKFVEEI